MAELWGSVVISVLFWGFANQVRRASLDPDMLKCQSMVRFQS
jgi:hypothetical protein